MMVWSEQMLCVAGQTSTNCRQDLSFSCRQRANRRALWVRGFVGGQAQARPVMKQGGFVSGFRGGGMPIVVRSKEWEA